MQPKAIALIVAFVATIPAANWLIGNVGTVCIPNGPCLIPVGFGLMAPSGVLLIGLALVLRDAVHRQLGVAWSFGAIAVGGTVSFFVSPPALAVASAAAFLLSETLDLMVYAPLAKRRLALAVLASGVIGAFADSALFLWLAFGRTDFLSGQLLGKLYASVVAFGLIAIMRAGATLAPAPSTNEAPR
jgi:uncharacterized PurR-regulated membrane protein YhhQ (DUF165 family)